MKLLRFAKFYLSKEPHQEWAENKKTNIGDVTITIVSVERTENKVRLLVYGEISIDLPNIGHGMVEIPVVEREKCENALGFLANLIACQAWCSREIGTVLPPVMLVIESDEDKKHLEKAEGISQDIRLSRFQPYIAPDIIHTLVSDDDRREGVMLLAEALAHSNSSGKYRDLVRLFESAFQKPCKQLSGKLRQFLNPKMNYKKQEIDSWFSLRNGASHGDIGQAPKRIIEADVSQIVPRMEQAALDVLFNKNYWHRFDKCRRDLWRPESFTTSPSLEDMHLSGSPGIIMTFIDSYRVYYLKEDIPHLLEEARPANWWPEIPYTRSRPPKLKVSVDKS
ncbi:hypothetical protein [Salinisphaera sp. T31B1]|uniref:hypothetical protein n=1 Tax=Salinisphaera sp. T31B1 TaxID=727963 RepID=UPI00333EB84C